MVSNLILRLISAVVLGLVLLWSIISGGIFFQLVITICLVLMLFEWITINKSKFSIMFVTGNIYISIPMLFWIYESRYYPETLQRNILWIFLVVWLCDTFAYFGGKFFKGPKFAPRISPNKTWSGVIIGSLFAFVGSCIYINKFMNGKLILIFISLLLVVASILGDLLESKVKRILSIKDSGTIIPGHGGLCDRFDSFLLTSILFIPIKIIIL